MSTHSGVETAPLIVNDVVLLTGIAQGGALVRTGGTLMAKGIVSGPLTIEASGSVKLSGVASGKVNIEHCATLDVAGVLTGIVERNDGLLTVAVGSAIHDRRVTDSGTLVTEAAVPIATSDSTPRFRLIDTGGRLRISEKL